MTEPSDRYHSWAEANAALANLPAHVRARTDAALLAEARRLHAAIVPHDVGPLMLSARQWQAERDARRKPKANPYLSHPGRNGPMSGRRRCLASRARTREQIAKWWRWLTVQIARSVVGRHRR